MIIAMHVLNNTAYLAPLYAVAFVAQFIVLFFALSRNKATILKSSSGLIAIYAVILLIPLGRNLIVGIQTNIYDYFSLVIKCVNFTMYYLLMQNICIKRESVSRFMRIIVVISIIACVYSLIADRRIILSIGSVSNTYAVNVRGFFANRNQFSSFLLTALLANCYLYIDAGSRKLNILAFTLQILCIAITFSRGALFSIIIVFGLLFLQTRKGYKKILFAIFAVLLCFVVAMGSGLLDFITKNYVRISDLDSGRVTLWKYAWGIAKDNYFAGVGFYTGADIAMADGMLNTQFHSMYMDLLVGGGVFELCFVMATLFSVYKKCVRKCSDKRYVLVFRAAFLVFLLRAGIESLSVFSLGYADTLYSIFYISMPILIANMRIPVEHSISLESRPRSILKN